MIVSFLDSFPTRGNVMTFSIEVILITLSTDVCRRNGHLCISHKSPNHCPQFHRVKASFFFDNGRTLNKAT